MTSSEFRVPAWLPRRATCAGVTGLLIAVFAYGVIGPEWVTAAFVYGALGGLAFGLLLGMVFGTSFILAISLGSLGNDLLLGVAIGGSLGIITAFVLRRAISSSKIRFVLLCSVGYALISGILVVVSWGVRMGFREAAVIAAGVSLGEMGAILIFLLVVHYVSMLSQIGPFLRTMAGITIGFGLGYCFIAVLFAGLHLAEYKYASHRGERAYIVSFSPAAGAANQSPGAPAGHELGLADFLYFSILTLSSTGYGDIQPVSWRARGLSCVEVVLGMAWVLVVFAGVLRYTDLGSFQRRHSER